MTLALASWSIAPNPDGSITIGTATMPASHAADLATRILQACGDTSAAQLGRVRCREQLDIAFAYAVPVMVRDMQTGATGRFVAYRDGRRLVVRLGDTMSACLLDEGERWRGFAQQWRDDPMFGCVAELALPMVRVSCSWVSVHRLEVR